MTEYIEISPAASDIVQYQWKRREENHVVISTINGMKTSQDRYVYLWLHEMNKFSTSLTRIPDKYKKTRVTKSFISRCVSNPNKHRVVRADMPRTANTKIYHTHDNGGRPFVVYDDIDHVRVYKTPDDEYVWREDWSDNPSDNVNLYTKLVYETKCNKVFVGKHIYDNPETIGNSILVDLGDNNYTFIGGQIYQFHTDEIITNYYSRIGNSDVPYPVATSQNYIYFMYDYVGVKKVALNVPEVDMSDAYTYFYDHYERAEREYDENVKKFDIQVIEKRLW